MYIYTFFLSVSHHIGNILLFEFCVCDKKASLVSHFFWSTFCLIPQNYLWRKSSSRISDFSALLSKLWLRYSGWLFNVFGNFLYKLTSKLFCVNRWWQKITTNLKIYNDLLWNSQYTIFEAVLFNEGSLN